MRPNDSLHQQHPEQRFSKGSVDHRVRTTFGEACENAIPWAWLQVTRLESCRMEPGSHPLQAP